MPGHAKTLISRTANTLKQTNKQTNKQAVPVTVHISVYSKSYSDKLTKVLLHTGDDGQVTLLFITIVHTLMMGQLGPKHVQVCVLKHYCNYNKVCAIVVGLHCDN
jgi:hypothetical protein